MSSKTKVYNIELPERVDNLRFYDAVDALDFIVGNHDKGGNYLVENRWGPEGEIYRAVCVWVLVDAYNITHEKRYLETAKDILARFKRTQRATGGWTISLGSSGLRFKITDAEREDSDRQEDPVIAGAILKSICDYTATTSNDEFKEMGEAAYRYICDIWDEGEGTVNENKARELTALRSNPEAYHFLILYGVMAWAKSGSDDAKHKSQRILDFVAKTFEAFDEETMPLMIGYHVAVLSKYKSLPYLKDIIRPKLTKFFQAGLFESRDFPGGYGHRDGLRGIVKDELNMRSAVGIAYAMKAIDFYIKTQEYTSTKRYFDICSWIDAMKANDGGFYEFQDSKDGMKHGKGSPAQYLSVLWILGTSFESDTDTASS